MTNQESLPLTPKQEKALSCLLSEMTITGAANKANVSERTIYTWLSEPAFKEAYRTACRASVQQSISQLQNATSSALAVLIKIMNDPQEKASSRLVAAKSVLESGIKAFELDDLAQRVEKLEQQFKENDYELKQKSKNTRS